MKRILSCLLCLLLIPAFTSGGQGKGQNQQIMLETIGQLSAQAVYLSYLATGTIADGHAKQIYDNDTAIELLSKIVILAQQTPQQLDKLMASGALGGEDIVYVNDLIQTMHLLAAQAGAYRNYITSRNQAHLQVFSSKRKEAWEKIRILLGIEG